MKTRIWTLILLICATGLSYLMYRASTLQSHSPKMIRNKAVLSITQRQPTDGKVIPAFSQTQQKTPSHISLLSESIQRKTPACSNWNQVDDWTTVAFSPKSNIILEDRGPYQVGDVVVVTIIVKDFKGRRKQRGGDEVRIWIKDPVNTACAAGHIEDNHDGSYRGSVTLLWAGNVTISARIATPREIADFLCQTVNTGRTIPLMKGLFKRGLISEVKMCSAIPDMYTRFCNLTIRNSNLPWYCEMPINISCNDWLSTVYYFPHQNYTTQEIEMFMRIQQYHNIGSNIHLPVLNHVKSRALHTESYNEDLVACNKIPTRMTWDAPPPRGYLYRGVWFSTQCRSTFDGSVQAFNTCLKGRKLWLLGDSTLRQFFSYLEPYLKLQLKTESWTTRAWHKPSTEVNKDRNITVFWGLHALPFLHSQVFDNNLEVKGTHLYIDSIPAKSRDIVVIHFYMHFMGHPTYVLRNHVRKARDSILALKTRAPEVKVVVKGPHSFHDERKRVGMFYDYWGTVYNKILREEFSSILNDVVFLDVWELTMSAENLGRHPNNTLVKATINYLMSFICL